MSVSSGGTANSTTVNGDGSMTVSSGGTANSTIVTNYGSMFVSSGGTATSIKENGGYVHVDDGAKVTFVANSFSGLVLSSTSATLHSGTTANSTIVYSGGRMYVYSGGTANSTTVNFSGGMGVESGGTANSTTVNYFGWMNVSSGGTALAIKENGGYVEVFDGADVSFVSNTISGLILQGSATLHSGTTADSTFVKFGRKLYVMDGGVANNTILNASNNYGNYSKA